ncbi:formate/nitrite transporter family protein [Candidatus Bipolaricaulota bacterium]|nr:formate/nitrite transporter family protein [Candidatus Bipolaricaulota bacterium]
MALNSCDICQATVDVGEKKAKTSIPEMFVLGILAGAFIGIGAVFYTITTTNTELGFGVTKLLGGGVFSLGLILVVIAGAELFTGNNLISVAAFTGRISAGEVAKNWFWVYLANFVGSILVVALIYGTGIWHFVGNEVGVHMVNIAAGKTALAPVEALTRGILCNFLVCLAVWMAAGANSISGKVMAIIFPITGFVAMGFEHSIANMYFIPMGIFLKGNAELQAIIGSSLPKLSWIGFLYNIGWVTFGNIIGGCLFVGVPYYVCHMVCPDPECTKCS